MFRRKCKVCRKKDARDPVEHMIKYGHTPVY